MPFGIPEESLSSNIISNQKLAADILTYIGLNVRRLFHSMGEVFRY